MNTLLDLYTKLDPNHDYIAADAETLTGGNIILIQDPDGIWQPFVITNSDTTMGSAMVKTVQADHLYYELGDGQPKSFSLTNATPSTAMTAALEGTRWQVGHIDASLIGITRSLSGELMNPLERLRQIESEYEARLRFRAETDGAKVIGLYVDLLEIDQAFRGQRFEFGRNLQSINITADFSEVKTALVGTAIGEEVDPLTNEPLPLTFKSAEWHKSKGDPADKPYGQDWVGDEEARRLYGIPDGQGGMLHRFGRHESEGTTPEGVLQGTWTALQRRCRPRVTVEAKVVDLEKATIIDIETGEPVPLNHEKVRLGNIVQAIAKHKGILAALELRVTRLIRPLKRQGATEVTLGDPIPLQSQRLIEMERWQKWADRRRRQLDRGKGPATVVVASEDTSKNPWYASYIIPTGDTLDQHWPNIMDMLPDAGGQLVFQEGVYAIASPLVADRDNLRISGQGAGTVFQVHGEATLLAVLDITGNNIQVADLSIDGNKGQATCEAGIKISTQGGKVQGVSCYNMSGAGIVVDTASEVTLIGNHCTDNDGAGIKVIGSEDITIEANVCLRNYEQGIYLYQSNRCSVIANKCLQSGGEDINANAGIYLAQSSENIIQGNISNDNTWSGIVLMEASHRNNINNNSVSGNQSNGIAVAGWFVATSQDNVIAGNVANENGGAGISVGDCIKTTIIGNTASDNGSDGIYLILVSDSNIQNNRCAGNARYGIHIREFNDDNFVTNNDLVDNGVLPLLDEGTGTITVPGNRT